MNERVTIADVAEKAGVSMMTVSRAINNKEGISEATRNRVLTIAHEMGFRPSGIARGLATNRTTTIGLVVPDIANPFFAELARGVEDVAHAHDYNVFLLNTNENIKREKQALESLWDKQVDGLIWCSSRMPQPEMVHYLERFSYVVLINRDVDVPVPGVVAITVEGRSGAFEAVTHFAQKNRRNVAFISGPKNSFGSQNRQQGFLEACAAYGIEINDSQIRYCTPTVEEGYKSALALLADYPEVDAILAYNDLVAIGVLQASRESNYTVPNDIAVISFDDIPLAALVTPSLTTLRIEKYGLGDKAMNILLQLIDTDKMESFPSHSIKPELILRESTP